MLIFPTFPMFLKPAVANALIPVCYQLFYWFSVIISPEALCVFAGLALVLAFLLVSLARQYWGGA